MIMPQSIKNKFSIEKRSVRSNLLKYLECVDSVFPIEVVDFVGHKDKDAFKLVYKFLPDGQTITVFCINLDLAINWQNRAVKSVQGRAAYLARKYKH